MVDQEDRPEKASSAARNQVVISAVSRARRALEHDGEDRGGHVSPTPHPLLEGNRCAVPDVRKGTLLQESPSRPPFDS